MKNPGFFLFIALLASISCTHKKAIHAKKVNPFIGTGGHGHTYPGATLPFGRVQLSPDTRVAGWDACSGYYYTDSTLLGFSHTHLSGTGAADYGDILFTPGNTANLSPIGFSHTDEQAWAGYYAVNLANNIKVELTATTRVGIHQYHFNQAASTFLTLNLAHGIGPDKMVAGQWQATAEDEISGFRQSTGWAKEQTVFFVARFSAPFTVNHANSGNDRAMMEFGALTAPLMVKVGLSAVSVANAAENIDKEAPLWDFAHYVRAAEKAWDKELGKIKAEFLNPDDEITFYTALYHSFLAPNVFSDVNGEYRGMDKQTHITSGTHYTVFSLWDTFRATHPLFTLLNRQRNVNMINTMLAMYQQQGLLPVWELAGNETGTMIGYHAIPVIADAMVKKLPGFDYDLALEAMQASAMANHLGLAYYREMGYIPAEKEHEAVSKTLAYAYDDWCIGQVAELLGEENIRDTYWQRAQFYKNLYDPATGFMRPRRNGNWLQPFDPYEVSGNYTEANAWQYNLFVPHDISNLNALYGPASSLTHKLDSLFTAKTGITGRNQPDIAGMIGQYAHGNEPSHNFAYLYNYTGKPWKTQALVHQITTELYANRPDGLSGNEDCGQMSAWYVFSALGFYPVTPGIAEYALGTPRVKKARLKLENGNVFQLLTHNLSPDNYYVQEAKLNGSPLRRSFITHQEIIKGGTLEFTMGSKPATTWHGTHIRGPVTKTEGKALTITPLIDGGEMTFADTTTINIFSPEAGVALYYTVDGSTPDSTAGKFTAAFRLDTTTVIKAIAYKPGQLPSKIAVARFIKIPYGRKISLKYPYSHNYTGNSSQALIDHIRGGNNFRDGWQGFHGVNLEAMVDLGRPRRVTAVKVGFLQEHYSWIFYPQALIVELSKDGKHFEHKKIIRNLVDPKADGLLTETLGTGYPALTARYVRVTAVNVGKCPDWHKGAGHPAWLFADEILIDTK